MWDKIRHMYIVKEYNSEFNFSTTNKDQRKKVVSETIFLPQNCKIIFIPYISWFGKSSIAILKLTILS